MRIGYVGNANFLECKANRSFRLASYSPQRLVEAVESNLSCLDKILQFNVEQSILFYRISSDLIPFASHPICKFDWVRHFKGHLAGLGSYIRGHRLRISMHPGQYTILNAPDPDLVQRSFTELNYHCTLLNSLGLDATAKIQIHVGGVYGDKQQAMDAFCNAYHQASAHLKTRLVIENDDNRFSLRDCLEIHARIGIPVIFDNLHHECLNNREALNSAITQAAATWQERDGVPMVDYSSQWPGKRPGAHAEGLDAGHFRRFLKQTKGHEMDIMLELRDKDLSALKALQIIEAAHK